ncbi:reticulon-like protein B17 isoform X1 [Beta vulgaris subsp. vulgaris]|uniref:reticulon-like protein B17 isoform X1 n=1 Tax=Beta vulgaris subsp. vulgaris TaxID=3555 RepID=UPI0020374E7B|nr:reticulon-like protein B17 isoform X1 [Beta vulgaris subsp. vulgaris]
MESIKTPISHKSEPSHPRKSASRLALMANNPDFGSDTEHQIPHFSVEYAPSPSPPNSTKTPSLLTPSKLSVTKPKNFLPLHEHLLLSPSPVRKSRTRLSDRLDVADDHAEHRRRCKVRTSSNGLSACFSPRNLRRSRRRIDQEERDFASVEEVIKPRKRRNSGKSKKEKLTSAPSFALSKDNDGEESTLDRVSQLIWELIMWRDVAKSSLWFGFGCVCFLSSCFTKGVNFSLFSLISQLGLLLLAASFIANSLHQRENVARNMEVSLKEDDILRVIKVILPALNLVISKTRELFSGEPSMTLKVALFLLVGAEYGHLLTLWRLCALGFFTSFTAPKLYSSYSAQIDSKAEQFKSRVLEAWRACYHKKIVAGSAATAFWNMSSLKTRIFAAFISLVILRYYRQLSKDKTEEEPASAETDVQPQRQTAVQEQEQEIEPQKVLVVADGK